jgi:hypothetical protein
MSGDQLVLCTNCGKDPQEEDANWCISCLMYVNQPLDNDELTAIRELLLRPRFSALKMVVFGRRFADRVIREQDGELDWWSRLRERVWYAARGSVAVGVAPTEEKK